MLPCQRNKALLLLMLIPLQHGSAFSSVYSRSRPRKMSTLQLSAENGVATFRRREITDKMFSSLFLCGTVFPLPISPARATLIVVSDLSASSSVVPPGAVEMKLFVDPQGLFVLSLPKRFFALRRTAKGDLPDEKTGSGRRGSSIFNAGDLAKAEVLAIERFPTRLLLEENGIEATGSLNSFSDLGSPTAIANLIALRRDRDKPGVISNTKIVPNSLVVSKDGQDLSFQLRTPIDVQKPELLMEQYGVSELFRITAAKASLRSNDGNMLAIFASALEQDWLGPDGAALQQSVASFLVTDRSTEDVG